MLDIHAPFDEGVRRAVETRFGELQEAADVARLPGIEVRLERIIRRLRSRSVGWQECLTCYCQALFELAADPPGDLRPESLTAAVAALEYVVEAEDIIPDHVPGTGFVDDAIAINLCLKVIRRGNRLRYLELVKRCK